MFSKFFKIWQERRAGDPLDDGVCIFQHMRIYFLEDGDLFRALLEDKARVVVNGQDGRDTLKGRKRRNEKSLKNRKGG